MTWRGRILAWMLLVLGGAVLRAQTPVQTPAQTPVATPAPPPAAEEQTAAQDANLPMHTLHVYMDLIQVPALVLDSERGRMKPIPPAEFRVSLDSGPVFRPRRVRQEGDDPITLGILLDPNSEPTLMPHLDEAVAALAPQSLTVHDHVTIFAMDCGLLRSLDDVPAGAAVLKAGMEGVLKRWREERKVKHAAPCPQRVQLWDAMAFALKKLGESPGRRVLLAVTTGSDGGSRTAWPDLLKFSQLKGVAIFGYALGSARSASFAVMRSRSSAGTMMDTGSREDPFDAICESSGGMIMPADPDFAGKQLVRFTQMVRERYILEFTRPRNDTPGEHNIAISIPRVAPRAYIRSAGVTILVPEGELADDPDTIPRDATDAPEMGKRKALKPN
jgi:hypothetical protein